MDFLAISSYRRTPSEQTGSKPASAFSRTSNGPSRASTCCVVEDIVDTGLTLHYILRTLELRDPASLAVCTLLDRPYRRLADIPVRYRGFTVPDDFFVGYGFDYQQHFRNLPALAFLHL